VSLDSPEKNAEFAASLSTQIPVLSDPKGETARRYGVLAFGGLYSKRWTFYIDETGTIRAIDKDVNPESAGQDILERLSSLGFKKRSSREPTPVASSEHVSLHRSATAILSNVDRMRFLFDVIG